MQYYVHGKDNISFHTIILPSLQIALALSASGANGETRDNMLSVIEMNDFSMDEINEMTGNIFRLLYTDNDIGKLQIANSIWCDRDITFKDEYLESAKENYYASVFSVDFSKEETGTLINEWILKQTNGTLGGNNPVSETQIMTLINTIYFYDQWTDRFDKNLTEEDIFYCSNGEEVTCNFMNKTFPSHGFYEGDGYVCSSLRFKNRCSMNFYLPDEDVRIYELISSPEKVESLLDLDGESNDRKHGKVIFQLPKFDYSSDLDMKEALEVMGMKEAFEMDADFTTMTDYDIAYISSIKQSAQISIDEIGCEAAAFTKIDYCGSAMPVDHTEMILDRPFLYTITDNNDTVIFVGVVNDPLKSFE